MVEHVGDWAFGIAAGGVFSFTLMFLFSVRWWTDWLGRSIAGVVGSVAAILALSYMRLAGLIEPPALWWARAFAFSVFAVAIWLATGSFVWAQFIAPWRKRRAYHGARRTPSNGGKQ